MAERWHDRLRLQHRPADPRWCLQGPPEALAALARAVGLPLAPDALAVGALAQVRGAAGLWLQLGPGEAWWLPAAVPNPDAAGHSTALADAGPFAVAPAALAREVQVWRLRGLALACTELGDAWVGWNLIGQEADEFLAYGCTIDLATLGPERCARTRLAQAPVVLAPYADGCAIWTERSHASYLQRWLAQALAAAC